MDIVVVDPSEDGTDCRECGSTSECSTAVDRSDGSGTDRCTDRDLRREHSVDRIAVDHDCRRRTGSSGLYRTRTDGTDKCDRDDVAVVDIDAEQDGKRGVPDAEHCSFSESGRDRDSVTSRECRRTRDIWSDAEQCRDDRRSKHHDGRGRTRRGEREQQQPKEPDRRVR